MPKVKDKWYHTTFKIPSKEEITKKYQELMDNLRERNARRLRKDERLLQEEGDE